MAALGEVYVGILLEHHQRVGGLDHGGSEVAVEVELGAHGDARPDDLAHLRQQVALAVVAAFGDHGAVQRQRHRVEGHGGAKLVENLFA